jgi:hypothetical protein
LRLGDLTLGKPHYQTGLESLSTVCEAETIDCRRAFQFLSAFEFLSASNFKIMSAQRQCALVAGTATIM